MAVIKREMTGDGHAARDDVPTLIG